jgi:hypothetical protein
MVMILKKVNYLKEESHCNAIFRGKPRCTRLAIFPTMQFGRVR